MGKRKGLALGQPHSDLSVGRFASVTYFTQNVIPHCPGITEDARTEPSHIRRPVKEPKKEMFDGPSFAPRTGK